MATKPASPTGLVSPERIARAPRRIEGHDKVRGRIRYAGDLSAASLGSDLLAAVAVTSTQSSGRILLIDGEAALASPGARLLVTHENAPKLKKVISITGTEIGDLCCRFRTTPSITAGNAWR